MKSCLAVAACLAILLPPAADAAAKTKPVIAISPITLSDTSGTPAAGVNALWSRIRALSAAINAGLAGSGLYEVKPIAKADCADMGEQCIAKWARDSGGKLIMIGTVLKMTPTVSHFWVGLFKPDGRTRVFYRDIAISGDGAAAWNAAGDRLVSEIVRTRPGL